MKYIILIAFLLISSSTIAGGDSKLVNLFSIDEVGENKYRLKYQEIKSSDIITLNLEYNSKQYSSFKPLSFDKYLASIKLLKKQLALKQPVRFGSFGSGPCLLNKQKQIYRSDALEIYDEDHSQNKRLVVYAFCEYK